jgi:hypothetical protein
VAIGYPPFNIGSIDRTAPAGSRTRHQSRPRTRRYVIDPVGWNPVLSNSRIDGRWSGATNATHGPAVVRQMQSSSAPAIPRFRCAGAA